MGGTRFEGRVTAAGAFATKRGKGSPSFRVSGQDLRNASDAGVFRLTNATLQIQPIEPGAGDPGLGTGSVEFARLVAVCLRLRAVDV
jgi:hypothetical protein